ncbi:MAG: HD-GYP domain-containing protein, partial [Bacillota bacterium]
LNEKFMSLLEFINKVKDFEKLTVNKILKQSFRFIFKLVDKSDYGSVYKYTENSIVYLDTIGHDLNRLQNIDIARDEFDNYNTVKPNIINNILKTAEDNYSDEIKNASKKISQTLNFSINSKDKLIASISLDIKKGSDKEFNENDVKIVESISRLLNIIISLMTDKRKENNFVNRILFSFISLIKIHNENLYKHSMNVGKLSKKFAKHLQLTEDLIDEAYYSGILHDIGYILQEGNDIKEYLEDDEEHIYNAYEVLKDLENLEGIAKIVYCHHEKYDGSGYPEGIKGSQIPVVSQILALVNFYEQEKNILKKDDKEIKKELNNQRNVAFDSSLIDEFLKMVEL